MPWRHHVSAILVRHLRQNDKISVSEGWKNISYLPVTDDVGHWWRSSVSHDDVIKWKHFPRFWPFVRGIHRSPVNSLHKGQWHGALIFSLICAWINGWVNNDEVGDLRRHRAHYGRGCDNSQRDDIVFGYAMMTSWHVNVFHIHYWPVCAVKPQVDSSQWAGNV